MIRRRVPLLLALLSACAVENPGIQPPLDAFYFPTGLAIDPAGRYLYVVNANSDLLYNAGTLFAVDLDRLPADLGDSTGAVCGCQADPTDPRTQVCDEACSVADAVKIGNFSSEVRVRNAGDRLYLTVRSNPRGVVWVDVAATADDEIFECGQQRFGDNQCASSHIVEVIEASTKDDETTLEQILPSEPFGLYLQEAESLSPRLFVTHLASGAVTVLDDCGDEVRALHSSAILFPGDAHGRRGAFAIAPRDPAAIAGPFYVTSRIAPQVVTIFVDPADERCGATTRVIPGQAFAISGLADGSDTRGIAFAADGNRAYVVDREPPTLVEVDTSLEDGVPRNRVTRLVELCPEPSMVRRDPTAESLTFFVVCFATSQIFVVNGDLMTVEAVIATGRGPNDLVFDSNLDRPRAYVTQFGENTIGVIDLDPESPTYRFLARRIGEPEPLR